MKIKSGYEVKNISGQDVVVYNDKPLSSEIILNENSLFLWNLTKQNHVTKSEMLTALLDEFDISTVLALGNIDVFVRTLKEYGVLEEWKKKVIQKL